MELLEADIKDVLWMRLSQEEEECLVLAVCYIPPESSMQGGRSRRNLPTSSRAGGKVWIARPGYIVW